MEIQTTPFPGKTQPLKSKTNKKPLQAPRGTAKEPPIQSQRRVFGTTRNANIPLKAINTANNVIKTKPDRPAKPLKKPPSIQVSPPKPPEQQTQSTSGEKKSPEENRAKANKKKKKKKKKKKSVGFEEPTGKGSEVGLVEGDGKGPRTPLGASTTSSVGKAKRAVGTPYQTAERCSSCRFDRLETSAYWLGQIKLAESVGKHFVSAAFFRLAVESKAEPIRSLRFELKRYMARHEHLSKEAEWKDVSASYGLIQAGADANSGSSTLDKAHNDAIDEQGITLDRAQTDLKAERAMETPEA